MADKVITADNDGQVPVTIGDFYPFAEFLDNLRKEGRLTDSFRKKVEGYMLEKGSKSGVLEGRIKNLNNDEQAEFMAKELDKLGSGEEKARQIVEWRTQGLLTDDVRDKLAEQILMLSLEKQKGGFFQNLFQ